MARPRKTDVLLEIAVIVPFYSYGSETKDKKARAQIKKQVKLALSRHLKYLPLQIEERPEGGFHDDCTGVAKFHVE